LTLAFAVFGSSQRRLCDVLNFVGIGVVQVCATLVCLAHATRRDAGR
jgi:hypothetical protein